MPCQFCGKTIFGKICEACLVKDRFLRSPTIAPIQQPQYFNGKRVEGITIGINQWAIMGRFPDRNSVHQPHLVTGGFAGCVGIAFVSPKLCGLLHLFSNEKLIRENSEWKPRGGEPCRTKTHEYKLSAKGERIVDEFFSFAFFTMETIKVKICIGRNREFMWHALFFAIRQHLRRYPKVVEVEEINSYGLIVGLGTHKNFLMLEASSDEIRKFGSFGEDGFAIDTLLTSSGGIHFGRSVGIVAAADWGLDNEDKPRYFSVTGGIFLPKVR